MRLFLKSRNNDFLSRNNEFQVAINDFKSCYFEF